MANRFLFILPLLLLLEPTTASVGLRHLGFLASPGKPASLRGLNSFSTAPSITRTEDKVTQALNLHVRGTVHGKARQDLATLLQRRDLDAESLCKLFVSSGPQFLREDDMGMETTQLAFERLRELWADEKQDKEWLTRALWMLTIVSKA